MLISKFDLYRKEWLDLVFANRNQQYGAYELRTHYNDVLSRAMLITFTGVAMVALTTVVISRYRPVEMPPQQVKVVPVDLSQKIYKMPEHKPAIAKPQTQAAQPAKATPVSMQKFMVMKPVPDIEAVDPPKLDPNIAVGPVDVKVPNTPAAQNADIGSPTGTGTGNATQPGPDVYEPGDQLQVLPEPVGGQAAWARFLQKNLRYPSGAQEQNIQGKVYLSFIIERDGRLSNIMVERKGGFGFDEEALRVLRLAPAWKPGMQNGQAVRVRYLIPINFQMADN